MAISNFGELKAGVQNWAARTDAAFVNRLGDFIALAEDRVYNGGEAPLRSPAIRAREQATTTDLTITDGVAPLPDRFLEAYRIYFEGQPAKELIYISPRKFHTTEQQLSTSDAEPVYYTTEGNTFLVQPGVGSGTGKLGFYQSFPALGSVTGDNDTNALLTKHPSLFLYSSLVAAFSWARNSAQATENFALYSSVAEGISQSSNRAKRSGQALFPVMANIA